MSKFEQYVHRRPSDDGQKDPPKVWVNSELKGKHREHCLCWSCKRLDVCNPSRNCRIAQKLFEICKEFNLVTPVYECPAFDAVEIKPVKS